MAPAAALFARGAVLVGSAAWWLLLSAGIGRMRALVTPARLRWINVVSGTLITAFGVASLLSAARGTA